MMFGVKRMGKKLCMKKLPLALFVFVLIMAASGTATAAWIIIPNNQMPMW